MKTHKKLHHLNLTFMRHLGLGLGLMAVLWSLSGLFLKGINYGIEFTGGVVTEFSATTPLEHGTLVDIFSQHFRGEFRLNSSQDGLSWTIRQSDDTSIEAQRELLNEIAAQQKWDVSLQESVFMGSQIGQELIDKGGLALLVSALCMMVYVAFRFEWRLASSAILALFHDVLIVLGVFAWFQIRFDLAVLAGLLAIMGYSLNDSIIVGDRIRELLLSGKHADMNQLVNKAVRSTFKRTIITSITTLTTIVSIGLIAGEVLGEFALALGIGVLVGTLSSISLAGTIPVMLGLSEAAYERPEESTEEGA